MTTVPQRYTSGQTDGQHAMALPAPLLLRGAGRNYCRSDRTERCVY